MVLLLLPGRYCSSTILNTCRAAPAVMHRPGPQQACTSSGTNALALADSDGSSAGANRSTSGDPQAVPPSTALACLPGRGTSVMTSGTTLRRSTVSVPPLPSPLQATRQGGGFPVPAPAPAHRGKQMRQGTAAGTAAGTAWQVNKQRAQRLPTCVCNSKVPHGPDICQAVQHVELVPR